MEGKAEYYMKICANMGYRDSFQRLYLKHWHNSSSATDLAPTTYEVLCQAIESYTYKKQMFSQKCFPYQQKIY